VIADLKTTQLSVATDNITLKPGTGVLVVKSDNLSRVHRYYRLFQTGTVAIVLAALLMIALSIWLSVHHAKTARRILFGTGILALVQAALLEAPAIVKLPGSDQVTQQAAQAVARALFSNLQIACLVVGILCLGAAVGSKLYAKSHR